MLTIVLTGGGSGGHITPLLPLAHELKKKDAKCKVVYIGLKGENLEGLQERFKIFDEVCLVPSGKFRRYHGESALAHLADVKTLFLNLRDSTRIVRGIFAARKILKRLQPDVVFSKGGYVVVPVGIAARWSGIPIITHDSDALPGLANRFIGRWAVIHATGMPAEHYSYPKDSIRYTGIPVDERIKPVTPAIQAALKKQLGIDPAAAVLLVGGAGNGARHVNELAVTISTGLFEQVPSLHILHVTGAKLAKATKDLYGNFLGPERQKKVSILGFTPDFYKYSGAADVVITRAGATTLAELALQRKAVIVIPAPFLAGGHQLENAKALNKKNAAEVLNNDVEPAKLLKVTAGLLLNKQRREELADNLGWFACPDATGVLAADIFEVAAAGAAK